MDAGEGDRHQRVAQRAHLEGSRLELARAARDREAARRAPEREDALSTLALGAAPDEDARRAQLETAEPADLHLEGALDAADAGGLPVGVWLGHPTSYSLTRVRARIVLLLAALALLLAAAGAAAAAAPPPVEAEAVLVADGRTGEVLYAVNEDERMPMASLTKLMTAIVTLERARPRDTVTVSPQAVGKGGSIIFLAPGEQLRVRDLLAAALIQSANDAAFALAAHVGDGSVKRFVGLMNAKAAELGLEDTRYARPDGLDTPRHYSTAEDTLRLARLAMRKPLVRELARTRTMRVGNRTFRNWNDLLWTFDGLFGVKTGHTDDAGWTEVAAARRGGTSLYAALLGSPSRAKRNADLAELLEWGFDQYARFTLVREGERYATASIPFSEERLELVAAGGASQVVRLGSGTQFVERVVAPAMVELPVRRDEKLGEVVVTDGGREVARVDLVATRDVEAPGFRERTGWYTDRALDEAGSMLSAVLPGI